MEIQPVFECFATLLEERLRTEVFTTEDSLRYTFFLALTTIGYCQHFEIVLEEPHPMIPGAEIDLRIGQNKERLSTAFEFKFDRPIPSGLNLPKTQKAGAVFKDLFRLAQIPLRTAPMRYFIYFTTAEMAGYFQNRANRLSDFYNLSKGDCFPIPSEFVTAQAPTFQRVVGDLAAPCKITGAYKQDYASGHALRIFQVNS